MAGLPEDRQSKTTERPSIEQAAALIAKRGLDRDLVSRAFGAKMEEWERENRGAASTPVPQKDLIQGTRPESFDAEPIGPGGRDVYLNRFRLMVGRLPDLNDPADVSVLNDLSRNRWSA